jgi:sec-independent protein translocase protein TatC
MGDPGLKRRRRLFRRRRKQKTPLASMTVVEHLGELRSRLIFSAVAFTVISIGVFIAYPWIIDFFTKPLCNAGFELFDRDCELVFTKLTGAFEFRLKMTALVGIALSSPVWLYQLWAFIVPALTSKEKRYAVPFMAVSIFLFMVGLTIAYLVMPVGIRFLLNIGGEQLTAVPDAQEYLNFIGFMLLGFGVMFELPIVLFFLGLTDVVPIQTLRKQRRVAIVIIAALAAIITPSQDPYTMIILAVPLYGFYEATILVLHIVLKRRDRSVR